MPRLHLPLVWIALLALFCCTAAFSQTSSSGEFVLYKFAHAIGAETYTIQSFGESYTLSSHFRFNDRNTEVPLETTFAAQSASLTPVSFVARGKVSRQAGVDDSLKVNGSEIAITRNGRSETHSLSGSWFIAEGYSPVAMQEQMMRWWLKRDRPAQFTVYPSGATVRIRSAETLTIAGRAAHGYTVTGLIWGQECLWMDDDRNLVALVSTDAEFDHFEAARKAYAVDLATFIAAAVRADLSALASLTATARIAPAKRLAIVGATLEDSTGAAPVHDSVILIEDGVIRAAGPRAKVAIPPGATRLDAAGKYAIPGLWDMHAHYEQVEWGPIYLASGITSVRDVGNEFDFIRTLHEELDRRTNPAIGPHLEFAGIIDGTGPMAVGATTADTPAQAVTWVDRYHAAGARQIKIYSSVKPEVVKAITAEAHRLGITVTGHIPEGMNAIEGVNAGMDQINHISYELPHFSHPVLGPDGKPDRTKPPVLELDAPRSHELISALQSHHTVLDPTVALYETFLNTRPLDLTEPGVDHLPPQLRAALDNPPATGERAVVVEGRWKVMMATLRALHAAGIPIVAGTDQAIPGYTLHRELEVYVNAGFTPLEALQAATIVPARALGVEKESGSLEPGKRGDVLLLNADPLADIHNTRAVWRTVSAGAVYDPAPLWRSVDFKP